MGREKAHCPVEVLAPLAWLLPVSLLRLLVGLAVAERGPKAGGWRDCWAWAPPPSIIIAQLAAAAD